MAVEFDDSAKRDISNRLSERLIGRHLRRAWAGLDARVQRFRHVKALRQQIAEVSSLVEALDKNERKRLIELMQVNRHDNTAERRGRANYMPSDDSYVALRKSGYTRIQSGSVDTRLNGMAMWLRGANRETTQATDAKVAQLAPQVERLLRDIVRKD